MTFWRFWIQNSTNEENVNFCWAGYKGTDQETDWLPTTELKHATKLVQDFHKSYLNKPRPLNSFRERKQDSLFSLTLLSPYRAPICSPPICFFIFLVSFANLSICSLITFLHNSCLRASGFSPKRGYCYIREFLIKVL